MLESYDVQESSGRSCAATGPAYDCRTTVFSPEGLLQQVEYAFNTVKRAGVASVAVRGDDSVYLISLRKATLLRLAAAGARCRRLVRMLGRRQRGSLAWIWAAGLRRPGSCGGRQQRQRVRWRPDGRPCCGLWYREAWWRRPSSRRQQRCGGCAVVAARGVWAVSAPPLPVMRLPVVSSGGADVESGGTAGVVAKGAGGIVVGRIGGAALLGIVPILGLMGGRRDVAVLSHACRVAVAEVVAGAGGAGGVGQRGVGRRQVWVHEGPHTLPIPGRQGFLRLLQARRRQ